MRKMRASVTVVLLAGVTGLASLGCGSSASTPGGPVTTTGGTTGAGGGFGGGFGNPGTDGGAAGAGGGGISFGNKDGGGMAMGGFGGISFGKKDGGAGATGTGGSSPGTGGAIGATVAIADYPAAFAQTLCARLFDCCAIPAGTDPNECVQPLTESIQKIATSYGPSISGGRVVYRGDKVAACLSKVKTEACGTFMAGSATANIFRDCDTAWEPKVPVGGTCEDSAECAGGWCAASNLKCAAKFGAGSPCADDVQCTTEFCDEAAMSCAAGQMNTPVLCPGAMP
jgi:hypothetical protein